jgi:hypothetical protein
MKETSQVRPLSMRSSSILRVLVLVASVPFFGACGRPATEGECKEILRRTAELELLDRLSDARLIEAELRIIEDTMRGPMMEKCVGKRITDGAMDCVRKAKNSEDLSRECFR